LEKHSGRIRHLSLDTNDWTEAAKRKAVLLERQCLIVPDVPTIAAGVLTVEAAVERYIESRGEAGTEPLHHDTLENYKKLLRCRLLDFCKENGGITELRSLEDVDFIRRFTESWRNLNPQRTQDDVLLDDYTKFVMFGKLRTFFGFCVNNDWMRSNPAKKFKMKSRQTEDEDEDRHGFELNEYQRILDAIATGKLTGDSPQVLAAVELMRWAGLRISDCAKFNDKELVRSKHGEGWVASFVQQKTKQRTEATPVPGHVVKLLQELPFRCSKNGKSYWFRSGNADAKTDTSRLREKVMKAFDLAQVEKPFTYPDSTPHALRHTMAIQNLNAGVDIKFVSKWLGHKDLATTIHHYSRWIKTTHELSEAAALESYNKQMAACGK